MSGVRLQCKAVRPSSLTLHPLPFQQRLLDPCVCERLKTTKANLELVWPRSRDRHYLLLVRSMSLANMATPTICIMHVAKVDE